MALSTNLKTWINRNLLKSINLKIDTLTIDRIERTRMETLSMVNHFQKQIFPIPKSMLQSNPEIVYQALLESKDNRSNLRDSALNDVGYTYKNDFYTAPDADVLYVMLNIFQPNLFMEVGSGNSTKVARQAIKDYQLKTKIWSIDPQPRTEIDSLCDKVLRCPIEEIKLTSFSELSSGDILFIDSSHKVLTGNDVTFLFLNILPSLPKGIILHIHDIFLPFEYPKQFIDEQREWSEQYLVQAILSFSDSFEVLWAGHYLQRNNKDFNSYFDDIGSGVAQSLWISKN
jgi:Methyltransferase domain